MATYVNNLRLTELATGEGSGTWGTTTNLNLKAISEGLGYNTVAITGDTTFTIPDGRTATATNNDKARSMYFAMTSSGSLSGTKVITFAPNTISRVMLIENATTGTAITQIKQGSGGTVNISNGKTKLVYMDGAGTGAKVIDISPTLDLTGVSINGASSIAGTSLDINGNADISGDLTLSAGADGALRFSAASSIKILDNSSTSLVIEEADNAYITFDTTNTSEKIIFAKLAQFASFKGTGSITVTDIKDEDDMSSNSATALATQQSIKAYVASQIVLFDTLAEVLAAGNTTGGTKISVDNTSGGIDLIDNAKIRLGTGNDLEIYHDGTNSIIREEVVSSGGLLVEADKLILRSHTSTEKYIEATKDGAVDLYHDNSKKLATTSSGIAVTGTTTSDSMRVGQQVSPYNTSAKQSAFLLGLDGTDDADKKNAAAFKITSNTGAGATVIEDMVDNNGQNVVYAGRHQYFMTKESSGAPESALGSDLSDSATSLTTSSNISSTVTATATRPSPAILSDGSGGVNESVMVYGISGTTLTIARGMDGTTPRAFTTANSAKIKFVNYTPRLIFGNDFNDIRFINTNTGSTSPYTDDSQGGWNAISVFDIDSSGPLIPAQGGAGAKLRFRELASNGTNTVTLIGPASTADITVTLPTSTGTLALTSDISSATAVGALNSGSITSGFGNIDNGSSTITTTGAITGGSLDINGAVDIDTGNAIFDVDTGTSTVHFKSTNLGEQFLIENNNSGSSLEGAPDLTLFCNQPNDVGDNDTLGVINFKGLNDAGANYTYAKLFATSPDVSNGEEKGKVTVRIQHASGGTDTLTNALEIHKDGIDVAGVATLTSGELANNLIIESTNDGTSGAPDIVLKRTKANNSDNKDGDVVGNFQYKGKTDNGTEVEWAATRGVIKDATNASYEGQFEINVPKAGAVSFKQVVIEPDLIKLQKPIDVTGEIKGDSLDIDGNADISGDLTLSAGADGALRFSAASSIKVIDNSATALVIEEADTAYMTFVTTNGSEKVTFGKPINGALTGDVTGNTSGSSGSCTGNSATATLATTVTVSDNTANTNFPVVFNNESNALLDDTGALTYNPSTGTLKSPSVTSSPSLANGTSLITGNISSADFKSYAGQRIVYYGSGAGEFDLFDAAAADIGKTFVIVNASDDTITLDVDGGGTAQFVGVLTGSSNDGQNTNITIVTGGVAELVCVRGTGNGGSAAAPNFIIFGSGI